jgi:hypothetical protein
VIIYAIVEDRSRDEIGVDSRLPIVKDIRISVLGVEDLYEKQVIPFRVGSNNILDVINQLGRSGWVCLPVGVIFTSSFWCYKHINDDSEYHAAIADIRHLTTPLEDNREN